jgi:hypothetical protein
MVACAQAGADAVDAATDSMSGMTSQPSIGAILASLEGSDISTGLEPEQVRAIDSYWAQTRLIYSPFEAGLTGPDSGKSLFQRHSFLFVVLVYTHFLFLGLATEPEAEQSLYGTVPGRPRFLFRDCLLVSLSLLFLSRELQCQNVNPLGNVAALLPKISIFLL